MELKLNNFVFSYLPKFNHSQNNAQLFDEKATALVAALCQSGGSYTVEEVVKELELIIDLAQKLRYPSVNGQSIKGMGASLASIPVS